MSAFCLDLQASAAVSAPLELDSDCMEPRAGGGGAQGQRPRRAGSGGLGVALEEELALLAGQRDDEADVSGPEAPAAGPNSELLSLFRQKEKDLFLAAKLGKALLERNQDLTKQYEQMHKDLNDRLEHLEQEKHELRRRLESREGEWEGRVAELETDVQHLQGELERHQAQLREADRDKTKAVGQLSQQNQRLLEQLSRPSRRFASRGAVAATVAVCRGRGLPRSRRPLSRPRRPILFSSGCQDNRGDMQIETPCVVAMGTAAEVERQLSTQVHSLRDDFREKSLSTSQHLTRLETLQAEITMLSERKVELEHRVHAIMEENELLQNTVEDLREKTMLLERQWKEKDLQLRQSQLELQEVQVSHRQLTARLEELTEERSLQGLSPHPPSLLCEIEQSMEQEEQEQEREQVRCSCLLKASGLFCYTLLSFQLRLQLWEAYCEVRSLCSHLRGNDVTDSALSTDSSMDESSETSSAKDVPTGSLHTSLLELRRLTQNLLDGNESTVGPAEAAFPVRAGRPAWAAGVLKMSHAFKGLQTQRRGGSGGAGEEAGRGAEGPPRTVPGWAGHSPQRPRGGPGAAQPGGAAVCGDALSAGGERADEDHGRDPRAQRAAPERHPGQRRGHRQVRADTLILPQEGPVLLPAPLTCVPRRKKAVEMELAKSKIDIMSLNSQLLDAIQQKLNLSQQLEAWQDDMHRVIDQQLMDKYQDEWRSAPPPPAGSSRGGGGGGPSSRRAQRTSDGDKKRFSFFKKN
ncbi:unnamed protein product, partial [Tetraodon nigroviridis]